MGRWVPVGQNLLPRAVMGGAHRKGQIRRLQLYDDAALVGDNDQVDLAAASGDIEVDQQTR